MLIPKDLDVDDVTFCPPDVTTFAGLGELGLVVVGQDVTARAAVLECRVVPGEDDAFCRRCGAEGVGVTASRVGWRTRRSGGGPRRCSSGCAATGARPAGGCGARTRARAADPRARLSRGAVAWALHGLVVQHLTVARVAEALGVAWDTANDAVLAEGQRVLVADPARFDGVAVIGVSAYGLMCRSGYGLTCRWVPAS